MSKHKTTDPLDTLRPEVRCATAELEDTFLEYRICVGKYPFSDEWQPLRAELLRLADENKRMRGIIETLDVEGHRRAEKAEAELAEARETIKRLNRRVQVAEAGIAEKVKASAPGSLGRALANAAACKYEAELAAFKARIAGSRHAFLGPNMDRITFLAEDIGPVGKYALVKVEE